MFKKMMSFLMVATFILSVASLGYSTEWVKGTIAKIEDGKLAIVDNIGQEVTISVQDPMSIEGLKVGDKVMVKDSKVKVIKQKEDISPSSATSSDLKKH